MATVSDLISIQLNIDTTNMQASGDAAVREIERLRNQIQQRANTIEGYVRTIESSVVTAARYVAGLMGVVLSFEGFRQMAVDLTAAGTSLGRFSETVEVAVGKVSAFEQAIARAGGRAEDTRSILAGMRADITQMRLTGVVPQWAQNLGRAPLNMDALQISRQDPTETLREIARRAQAAHMTPTELQSYFPIGMSPETAAVFTHPGELERQLSEVSKSGTAATEEYTQAAERLNEKFAGLSQVSTKALQDLFTITEPFLGKLIEWVTTAIRWVDSVEQFFLGTQSVAPLNLPSSSRERTPQGPYSPVPGRGRGPTTQASPVRGPAPPIAKDAVSAVGGGAPSAFIMHHTGGRGDVAGVQATLQQRGLGVEYVMDRDGNIYQIGGPGSSHMMPGWGVGAGLSNQNTVGMEVIARDDKDVTPEQIEAAKKFIREKYPSTPVFGHGEVNPGHKEADEGKSIVDAIRVERGGAVVGVRGSTFNDITTASGKSALTTSGIAIPAGGKMGDLYEVTTPDGRKFITPLIDRGPAAWTGRGVDISEPLAREMGYDPSRFPTDSVFGVKPYVKPQVPNVDTGAAAALNAPGPVNQTNNNDTTAVVNHVTVHTQATNASDMARDIRQEVGRQLTLPNLGSE